MRETIEHEGSWASRMERFMRADGADLNSDESAGLIKIFL